MIALENVSGQKSVKWSPCVVTMLTGTNVVIHVATIISVVRVQIVRVSQTVMACVKPVVNVLKVT
jgi:hypothetical protein